MLAQNGSVANDPKRTFDLSGPDSRESPSNRNEAELPKASKSDYIIP
jgi:hypothetical protein